MSRTNDDILNAVRQALNAAEEGMNYEDEYYRLLNSVKCFLRMVKQEKNNLMGQYEEFKELGLSFNMVEAEGAVRGTLVFNLHIEMLLDEFPELKEKDGEEEEVPF